MSALRRFLKDKSGLAAIEFAWVLPIMLGLLLGGLEITNALQADRKTTSIAASVSDLVAQTNSLSNNQRDDIFAAADALIGPYDPAQLTVVISSVTFVGGQAVIAWSDGHRKQPRTVNSVVTNELPNGIIGAGSSIIMAEVTYHYADPLSAIFTSGNSFFTKGVDFTGGFDFGGKFYDRPRRSVAVARVP
jgi:Flp pilus assembly protein TadG